MNDILAGIVKRYRAKHADEKIRIKVCAASGCKAKQSSAILNEFKRLVAEAGKEGEVFVGRQGCMGLCAQGPVVSIEPMGIMYRRVKLTDVAKIFAKTVLEGEVIKELLVREKNVAVEKFADMRFFAKQKPIALGFRSKISPYCLENFIAAGGYAALAKTLDMQPENIIDEIAKAKLRGRGGAGFPTYRKWELARKTAQTHNSEVFVVCNADHGAMHLESNPHSVIEGMAIAAFALGAKQGFIYTRHSYTTALEALNKALDDARKANLLGENILSKNFDFDIEVRYGAGAFVGGQASAVVEVLSGRIAEPSAKYIHSAEVGLRGLPTVVKNVETWMNIAPIIANGAQWFCGIGTKNCTGSKIVTISGAVANSCTVEIEMGTALRDIIDTFGGGTLPKRTLKAVHVGGATGGILPPSLLDTSYDFDSLAKVHAIIGSGAINVLDERSCIVHTLFELVDYLVSESCGKCTPCREGFAVVRDTLRRICDGEGEIADLATMQDLAETIAEASFCNLGKTGALPILTALEYFRPEFENHIVNKKCSAGVCKKLFALRINEKCTGCHVCFKNCPVNAIEGEIKFAHRIQTTKCILCGVCRDVCKFDAVEVI